jgi:hypothetical protein
MRYPNYYLTISSTFFIAPTIYGIYKGHMVLSLISFVSTAASVNYWLNPSNEYSRTLDLITSKSCGVIYFLYGYNSVESFQMRMAGYANLCLLVASYNASCVLYNKYTNGWIPFHFAFHIFTTIGKFIVLG